MGGVFIRSFLAPDWFSVILVLFVGGALICAGKIIQREKLSPILVLGLACIAVSLGMARLHLEETHVSPLSSYEGRDTELIGKVLREPEERESTMHFYIKPILEGDTADEYVLVTTEKFGALSQNIQYGDIIRASDTVKQPETFESDGGRMFDYPGYLKTKGVRYTMQFAEVSLHERGAPTLLSKIYSGKSQFIETLEHHLPMPHAGLGEGILLGVRRALGSDLEQNFRETGIIHIVVLSGYNVMIVVETMMLVLAYFFLPRMRMVIGLAAIALFVILVGPSATVVRASIMAGLLLVARATGRIYAILRALILAGIAMLLVNPYLLVHDPGFQLSFLATLALIMLAPFLERKLSILPERLGIRKIITATLVTQFLVLPLLLYHTGLLSLVSVLVNVLVLPTIPIAMLLTFMTGTLGMLLPFAGQFLGFLSYLVLGYIIGISEFFGSLPLSSVLISKFPAWVMFLAYGLIAYWMTSLFVREAGSPALVEEGVQNYADWTIEEETENEKAGDKQSLSPAGELPFR